jgi:hypothetical protein
MSLATAELALDVERGLELRKQIKKDQDELKEIEARLEAAGLDGEQVELKDAEREGRQFLARGDKHIVPVIFTADLLIKSFQDKSKHHVRIVDALPEGVSVKQFYKSSTKWEGVFESGKKFRAVADEMLGKDAPKFITACVARDKDGIAKSAIKVDWDHAEEVVS